MIKVFYGPKGTGKTKLLTSAANKMAKEAKGAVVFIDDSTKLIHDLVRAVRFVNISDFPKLNSVGFFGFICGILSQNYDIEGIFIDRLNLVFKDGVQEYEGFFEKLSLLAGKCSTEFFISLNGATEEMPAFLKKYTQ
jgi:energy-coupling factor transporter ATP-binding protein EcfA2